MLQGYKVLWSESKAVTLFVPDWSKHGLSASSFTLLNIYRVGNTLINITSLDLKTRSIVSLPFNDVFESIFSFHSQGFGREIRVVAGDPEHECGGPVWDLGQNLHM